MSSYTFFRLNFRFFFSSPLLKLSPLLKSLLCLSLSFSIYSVYKGDRSPCLYLIFPLYLLPAFLHWFQFAFNLFFKASFLRCLNFVYFLSIRMSFHQPFEQLSRRFKNGQTSQIWQEFLQFIKIIRFFNQSLTCWWEYCPYPKRLPLINQFR